MSEISRGLDISANHDNGGPDYFGFYACEVAALLCQGEEFMPFSHQASDDGTKDVVVGGKTIKKDTNILKEMNNTSGSAPLFSNSLGTWIPEFKKDRLKSLLRQCVFILTQEVDEMLDPVFSMCRIQKILRYKKSVENDTDTNPSCEPDKNQPPQKKIRSFTASLDSETTKINITVPGKAMPDAVMKKCFVCSATEFSDSVCNACSTRLERQREALGAEVEESNDDLQFLLQSDSSAVEHILEKHSNELLMKIKHMENMLDKIIDIIMLNCRSMSLIERQELKKLIQNLPATNLDSVVDIIQRSRPVESISGGDIVVDLEKEDKATLWRLYYYVQTVESAAKLHKAY